MDSLMTKVANHKSLSPTCSHSFDPSWSFSASSLKICELSDMMNFYVLSCSTQFAFLGKKSFDQFVALWSSDIGALFDECCHWLSFERYAPKSGHKRFLSFSLDLDFQTLVPCSVGCLEACLVLVPLCFHAALVFAGKRLEQ